MACRLSWSITSVLAEGFREYGGLQDRRFNVARISGIEVARISGTHNAERLKENYGCAYEPMVDPADIIQLPSTVAQGDRQIPRELLAHIIHQRMDEIFNLVQTEISTAGYRSKLSGGIVLAGGGAAMQGAAELASDVFGTGVRIGVPRERLAGLTDAVEAPRFSTIVGLAEYGAHRMALGTATSAAKRMKIGGKGLDGMIERVKFYLQDFW